MIIQCLFSPISKILIILIEAELKKKKKKKFNLNPYFIMDATKNLFSESDDSDFNGL